LTFALNTPVIFVHILEANNFSSGYDSSKPVRGHFIGGEGKLRRNI
jgi:hypothetical protein